MNFSFIFMYIITLIMEQESTFENIYMNNSEICNKKKNKWNISNIQ